MTSNASYFDDLVPLNFLAAAEAVDAVITEHDGDEAAYERALRAAANELVTQATGQVRLVGKLAASEP